MHAFAAAILDSSMIEHYVRLYYSVESCAVPSLCCAETLPSPCCARSAMNYELTRASTYVSIIKLLSFLAVLPF